MLLRFANTSNAGREIYSKIAGYDSISPDAKPLQEDAVLKVASATKLMSGVALLQCIDQGLLSLDEPMSRIVPELDALEILDSVSDDGVTSHAPSKKITPRHLLSHMSGLGYTFLNPSLIKWRAKVRGNGPSPNIVTERYSTPLLFEPGEGWQYGSSLDWAGVAVRRLHHTSLEEYMIEHMWKPLGRPAPYPTFHVSQHPEYKARLLQGVERSKDGGLQPTTFIFGDNPEDEEGGAGLAMTTGDYVAVLADLVAETPKLLKPETIALMFEPQLHPDSAATKMMLQLKPAWAMVGGPVPDKDVNYGLGGALFQAEAPEICQPKNLLGWGGASNIVWWVARDQGVAGFFATQMTPFGDKVVSDLVDEWKKDFWTKYSQGQTS